MNSDECARIKEALAQAMRTERDGATFYRMAAMSMEDSKGIEVFQQLAREEDKHFSYLERHHDTLGSECSWVDFDLDKPSAREVSAAIFSPAIKDRIATAHFEMSALSVGIKLELDSERFYLDQAEAESHEKVAAFWKELAAWEKMHYKALLDQYDALKESYWQAQGFAPF